MYLDDVGKGCNLEMAAPRRFMPQIATDVRYRMSPDELLTGEFAGVGPVPFGYKAIAVPDRVPVQVSLPFVRQVRARLG